MIKIINTYEQVQALFDDGHFQFENWKTYINSIYENAAPIFTNEIGEYLASGKYTFEKDFLPIIESA